VKAMVQIAVVVVAMVVVAVTAAVTVAVMAAVAIMTAVIVVVKAHHRPDRQQIMEAAPAKSFTIKRQRR